MTQTRYFIAVVWLAFGWLVFVHPPPASGRRPRLLSGARRHHGRSFVNLLDVNILVYAFRKDTERHKDYRSWLLDLMNEESAFAVSDQVLSSVIRLTTHPRIFREPSALKEAIGFTDSVRQHPNCRVVYPSESHWSLFTRLCEASNAKANLVKMPGSLL